MFLMKLRMRLNFRVYCEGPERSLFLCALKLTRGLDVVWRLILSACSLAYPVSNAIKLLVTNRYSSLSFIGAIVKH
jgi:hypothetical protein